MLGYRQYVTVQDPQRLVLSDLPVEVGQKVEVIVLVKENAQLINPAEADTDAEWDKLVPDLRSELETRDILDTPRRMQDQEEWFGVISEGLHPDQQALFQDALRALLRGEPELCTRLALNMYRHGKVSLSRAAEIAGVDLESLKESLGEAGIGHVIPPVGKAIRKEVEHLVRLRNGGKVDHH